MKIQPSMVFGPWPRLRPCAFSMNSYMLRVNMLPLHEAQIGRRFSGVALPPLALAMMCPAMKSSYTIDK